MAGSPRRARTWRGVIASLLLLPTLVVVPWASNLVPAAAAGEGGALDLTFGGGEGFVANWFQDVGDVLTEPDGSIIVAGRNGSALAVARGLPSGELDPSFGDGGLLEVEDGYNRHEANAIVRHPAGGYVVVGTASTGNPNGDDVMVVRITEAGQLDPSFVNAGVRSFDVDSSGDDQAFDVAARPDGSIVVVGTTVDVNVDGTDLLVVLLADNGENITSFDDDSFFIDELESGSIDAARNVVANPDGTFVVAGDTDPGDATGITWIQKFDGAGPVSTFAGDSRLEIFDGIAADLTTSGLVRTHDGAFLVSSHRFICAGGSGTTSHISKITAAGALDGAFGTAGVVEVCPTEAADRIEDIALDSEGRIVATGESFDESFEAPRLGAYRLTASGAPDSAFGVNGYVAHELVATAYTGPQALAVDPDGGIVVAGRQDFPDSEPGSFVARLVGDATPEAEPLPGVLTYAKGADFAFSVMVATPGDVAGREVTGATSPGVNSDPHWSPDGGRIVFVRTDFSSANLFTIRPDGTDEQAIPPVANWNADPAWSPDGKYVAFAADQNGDFDIFLYDVAAGTSTNLTNTPAANEGFPSWSPDSLRLIFKTDASGSDDIAVLGIDGSGFENLTASSMAQESAPAWSSDGTRIAFTSDRSGSQDIWVMNADGTGVAPITATAANEENHAAWSPDDSLLAFERDSDIVTAVVADGVSGPVTIRTDGIGDNNAPDWVDNLTITSATGAVPASPSQVPIDEIPIQSTSPAVESAPIGNLKIAPVGNLKIGPIGNLKIAPIGNLKIGPVGNLKIGPIGNLKIAPVGNLKIGPVGNLKIGSAPAIDDALRQVSLGTLPLLRTGGWDAVLAGTPLAGRPLQTVSLYDVLALPVPPEIALNELDASSSPLGEISLFSFALGSIPLSAIDIGPDGWCPHIEAEGWTCAEVGGENATLIELQLLGMDLATAPIGDLDLFDIDFDAAPHPVPLLEVLLSDVDLRTSSIGSVLVGQTDPMEEVVNDPNVAWDTTLYRAQQEGKLLPGAKVGHARYPLGGHNFVEIVLGLIDPSLVPLGQIPVEGMGISRYGGAGSHVAEYEVSFTSAAGTPSNAVTIAIELPESSEYKEGTAVVTLPSGPVELDPVVLMNEVRFRLPDAVAPGENVNIRFAAFSGMLLGADRATSARVTGVGLDQRVVRRAPVDVVEAFEPNSTEESATPIQPDQLYVSHVGAKGDVDYYAIDATPGTRLRVLLSTHHDNDLVVYGPPNAPSSLPMRDAPITESAILPVPDNGASGRFSGEPLASESLQDVPLLPRPVLGMSDHRNDGSEYVDVVVSTPGQHLIQVSAYNGEPSASPYGLAVSRLETAPAPPCAARSFAYDSDPSAGADEAATRGPQLTAPTTTKDTLIIANRDRLHDQFGSAEAQAVMDKLSALAQAVNGQVLSVDSDPGVQAAYAAWDTATGVCDPEAANAVVRAINAAIDAVVDVSSVKHIVVVGSDETLPMGRIADLTQTGNERTFAGDLSATGSANALLAAFRGGFVLSDDVYADSSPTPYLGRWLYVADSAIGRLVETPADIVGQIDTFLDPANAGMLEIDSALTTGYEFMADMGHRIDGAANAALNAQPTPDGGFGAPPAADLLTETWSADDLRSRFIAATDIPDVLGVNAHFRHDVLLPAAASATGASPLVGVDELVGRDLSQRLLFTMGCHSGLNVADVLIGASSPAEAAAVRDWAQAFASGKGSMVGQTGYGLGLDHVVALSEEILSVFAENLLSGTMSTGQALMLAKQQYVGRLGINGVYDAKALGEAVLYGLPMWRAGTGTVPVPSPAQHPTPDTTGLDAVELTLTPSVTATQTGDGVILSGPNGVRAVHDRPLQPQVEVDVTAAGTTAHGAVLTELESHDITGFDPVFARPVIDLAANEPEIEHADVIFPSSIHAVTNRTTLSGDRQALVVVPAQFTSTGRTSTGEVVGRERVYDRLEATVYYSTSADHVKPVIRRSTGALSPDGVAFSIDVSDLDHTGAAGSIQRVVVMYLDESGLWQRSELSPSAVTDRWVGTGAAVGDTVQYFAQAVDGAGNVAVTTNKGELFDALVVPEAPEQYSVSIGGSSSNGWYTTATVTITGPHSATFEYSLDGAPFQAYTGPIVIDEDGVHELQWRSSLGEAGTETIRVDGTAPTIAFSRPSGQEFRVGDSVMLEYTCSDFGGGIATCDGDIATGSAIDTSSVRTNATIDVDATDVAGNASTATWTYSVVPRFTITGYYQPVDNLPALNSAKAGQSVPVKWRVYDGATIHRDLGVVAAVRSYRIACPSVAAQPVEELATVMVGQLFYDYVADQFHYNWRSDKKWGGTCRRFEVELDDGTIKAADFQFK